MPAIRIITKIKRLKIIARRGNQRDLKRLRINLDLVSSKRQFKSINPNSLSAIYLFYLKGKDASYADCQHYCRVEPEARIRPHHQIPYHIRMELPAGNRTTDGISA